ncbi:hypothetical protein M758_6G076100 [Ceratodon purpureus]|uniref:Uncharacterized protein n=1 Tax=Ceratodon purpureus TaxID=3225 RepID=A0A8T0HCR9_CERPU|nr:hypothetical protein KC19_6G080800 [Ceratodon purpureus]KAG0613091.1 hypothetical protein M758_6G076100 [Ceratodon purpureus]
MQIIHYIYLHIIATKCLMTDKPIIQLERTKLSVAACMLVQNGQDRRRSFISPEGLRSAYNLTFLLKCSNKCIIHFCAGVDDKRLSLDMRSVAQSMFATEKRHSFSPSRGKISYADETHTWYLTDKETHPLARFQGPTDLVKEFTHSAASTGTPHLHVPKSPTQT